MNIWVAIYRFSWLTLGVLIAIGILCLFIPQYSRYQEYQRRDQELQEKIRAEEQKLKDLKQKEEQFYSDPRFVEKIAHEIGLAREDETLFKFTGDEPAAPNSQ